MAAPRFGGLGDPCPLPLPLLDFLSTKMKFTSKKIAFNKYEILNQKAGNGHFRDSNFQKKGGNMPPDYPRKFVSQRLLCPPPPLLKVLDPLLFWLELSHTQQFFNLGISDLCLCKNASLTSLNLYSRTKQVVFMSTRCNNINTSCFARGGGVLRAKKDRDDHQIIPSHKICTP